MLTRHTPATASAISIPTSIFLQQIADEILETFLPISLLKLADLSAFCTKNEKIRTIHNINAKTNL